MSLFLENIRLEHFFLTSPVSIVTGVPVCLVESMVGWASKEQLLFQLLQPSFMADRRGLRFFDSSKRWSRVYTTQRTN